MTDYKKLTNALRLYAKCYSADAFVDCSCKNELVADLFEQSADEIEKLANENKELRDERDVDHYANVALDSALEAERKKHEWRDMNVEQPTEGTLAIVGWWTEYGWWHVETGVYEYDEEGEDLRWSYNDDLVTHWIPLPDAPKGAKQ